MDWIVFGLLALDVLADLLLLWPKDPFAHWRCEVMADVVMCGHCHSMCLVTDCRPPLCGTCGHQAGLSRIACSCVQCELRRAANAVCRALDCAPVYPGRPTAALAEALSRMEAAGIVARGDRKEVEHAAVEA